MEKVYPIQAPIINYSDTLFVYKFHEGEIRLHAVTDHSLVYVYSGEMTIINKNKTLKLYAGDCAFLARNHNVNVSARPYNGIELKSVFLTFTRPFLVRYSHLMDKSLLPSSEKKENAKCCFACERPSHTKSFSSSKHFFQVLPLNA